jgi:hypothetical protein
MVLSREQRSNRARRAALTRWSRADPGPVELPPRRAFRPADPAAQGRALRRTSKTHTSVPRSGFGIRGSGGLFEGDRPVLHLMGDQIRETKRRIAPPEVLTVS